MHAQKSIPMQTSLPGFSEHKIQNFLSAQMKSLNQGRMGDYLLGQGDDRQNTLYGEKVCDVNYMRKRMDSLRNDDRVSASNQSKYKQSHKTNQKELLK